MIKNFNKLFFISCLIFCLTPYGTGSTALLLGSFLSLFLTNPYSTLTKKYTSSLLQLSVIGLGAGMNLKVVASVGLSGISYTVFGIMGTFLMAIALSKILKVPQAISTLIATGTAICGGSAIAAVSPVIHAKEEDITVSLAVVFILNALALVLFPPIGHFFNLTQQQFGLWAALAIHDTSSVVGASLNYGAKALEVATTVKLTRALWIIPLTLTIAQLSKKNHRHGEIKKKIKYPWFILGFLLMATIMTWSPSVQSIGHGISLVAKKSLVLTLFLIGSGLSMSSLKKVGLRPLIMATLLWIFVASLTLFFILRMAS